MVEGSRMPLALWRCCEWVGMPSGYTSPGAVHTSGGRKLSLCNSCLLAWPGALPGRERDTRRLHGVNERRDHTWVCFHLSSNTNVQRLNNWQT